jgi:hypothetical protein
MPLALYLDHQVPKAVALGLRLRGADVLTAYDDRAHALDDAALPDRATALGRVLVTEDDDLLREAARRQQAGSSFAGVIYGHPLQVSVGAFVPDLELIARLGEPEELLNQIQFLPL